ncbi:MAG: hypothetical protein H0X01_04745 [Nitrospira sp.]|nr:hypothetical protein [Nitrospira sp.]
MQPNAALANEIDSLEIAVGGLGDYKLKDPSEQADKEMIVALGKSIVEILGNIESILGVKILGK